jgi:hypothetical protein
LPEVGAVPLGLSARQVPSPAPGAPRPVGSMVLRSGEPRAGLEAGVPGYWAMGVSATRVTGRLARVSPLPRRAVVPPFLPFAEHSTFDHTTRTFSPGQPEWNAAASAGAEMARVEVVGSRNRYRIYFPLSGSQTEVRFPILPAGGGPDPADEETSTLRVTLLQFTGDVDANDVLSLGGFTLDRLPQMLDGYSRWDAP